VKYEIEDQQWVASEKEAGNMVRMLTRLAAGQGKVIGKKRDGGGYLVTVEKPVED
jgi:hypothetical protein